VALRKIEALDLPLATATDRGAVIVNGGGLKTTAGTIGIDNAVAASTTYGVVTYDAHGLVTAGRALLGADLPLATATSVGAIRPGSELTVDGTGVLSHTNRIVAGTGTRVSYDAYGHITGSSPLRDTDIPELDAAKITSGVLPAGRIANGSITRQMLADYAITYIQEGNPPTTGNHAGTLWLQESTGALRMWNSNSWFPIGFGRLSAENLRYCGTVNAATGVVAGLTQFGTTEGFKIGSAIPAATDGHAGAYLVVATPGNGIAVAPGVTFDNGDWIVCNGATAGWIRIDTLSSGGGGGGGATHLNDLLDVTISAGVTPGNLLEYDASGQWLNVSEIEGGVY
jgi:hypothetical protein